MNNEGLTLNRKLRKKLIGIEREMSNVKPARLSVWRGLTPYPFDRSGDIVLIMKSDMSDINQRFSTGVSYKSWHGSLNRSDSYVPFIFAYPGGNKFEMEEILQKDTLCKADYSNCKGNWKLMDIVKEIILEQYE